MGTKEVGLETSNVRRIEGERRNGEMVEIIGWLG